jgi:4-aminobutyrate aminotransferase/(S)-3-amino-2-methylpropionate transaminase
MVSGGSGPTVTAEPAHGVTRSEEVLADRARFVARGIAEPQVVVERALGAHIWDVDGREYLDFAGGIGCANLGHSPPAAVAAVQEQIGRYLHQCFVIAAYEPYVELCRRLAELSPCSAGQQKSILLSTGAEAVENAVKIARAATGRPAVVVFDNAFHGRTLLTMTMTSKITYKRGFGPFAPEVYRASAPYSLRGLGTADALASLEHLFATEVDPRAVAAVVLEPVQGEGGFLAMPVEFVRRLAEVCAEHGILFVDDEVQTGVGRTGRMWAIEHFEVEPDLCVSGKSLGGGFPLAAVTGRAEVMDAVAPGGLGGTFAGNPVACAAALATLDAVEQVLPRAAELGETLRAQLEDIAAGHPEIAEVRGLGPMLAFEFREREPTTAAKVVAEARTQGLLLLTCGLHANVIRFHVPLTIEPDELARGIEILAAALDAALAPTDGGPGGEATETLRGA